MGSPVPVPGRRRNGAAHEAYIRVGDAQPHRTMRRFASLSYRQQAMTSAPVCLLPLQIWGLAPPAFLLPAQEAAGAFCPPSAESTSYPVQA